MATLIRNLVAIASPGPFVSSGGTLVDALSTVGGTYGSVDGTSGQMFGSINQPGLTEPINSVSVRARLRIQTAGSRNAVAALRQGSQATIRYHVDTYTVTSTDWAYYTWTWALNPDTGLPWQPAELNTIDRLYLRCTTVNGATPLDVDYYELSIDYSSGPITVNLGDTIVGTDAVDADYDGDSSLAAIISDTVSLGDMITVNLENANLQIASFPLVSVGNAGNWVASAGTLTSALAEIGGEYAISGLTTSNMFGGIIPDEVPGDIEFVRICQIARVAEPGARTFSTGVTVGPVTVQMHPTNHVITSTDWETYSWDFALNPYTNSRWTNVDILAIQRVYSRASSLDGTTNMHVDHVWVEVGYLASGSTTNYEIELTDGASIRDTQFPQQLVIDYDEGPQDYTVNLHDGLTLTDLMNRSFTVPGEIETGSFMWRGHRIVAIYLGSTLIWTTTS